MDVVSCGSLFKLHKKYGARWLFWVWKRIAVYRLNIVCGLTVPGLSPFGVVDPRWGMILVLDSGDRVGLMILCWLVRKGSRSCYSSPFGLT